MRNLDIYIYRLGKVNEGEAFFLPYIGRVRIHLGYLNIAVECEIVYEIYTFLGKIGIEAAQIVPLKYKTPNLNSQEASRYALDQLKESFNQITLNKAKLHFVRENLLTYTFVLISSELDTDYYVSIDKCDGHIHPKHEQCTGHQEEYYLDINTTLSIVEIENILAEFTQKLSNQLIGNEGIKDVFCFENIYLEVFKLKRTYAIEDCINFVSNIRIIFYLPKYKVGYINGRRELMKILDLIKVHLIEGILFANYRDSYILHIENGFINNTDVENWSLK